ncbi:MAG: TonB family protein [Thiohalospira sp.]
MFQPIYIANRPESGRYKTTLRLVMNVAVEADGSVREVRILRSSGDRILDEAAKHIVEMAAPFQPFPDNIRKDYDVLNITRTWVFNTEDRLDTGGVR